MFLRAGLWAALLIATGTLAVFDTTPGSKAAVVVARWVKEPTMTIWCNAIFL